MGGHHLDDVLVTTVDNYQGEENDIVLLSLVRSSEKGPIGFLAVANRVCVALSRARCGFYMFGNGTLLAKKSPLWSTLLEGLKATNGVGAALPLAPPVPGSTKPLPTQATVGEREVEWARRDFHVDSIVDRCWDPAARATVEAAAADAAKAAAVRSPEAGGGAAPPPAGVSLAAIISAKGGSGRGRGRR